MGAVLAEAPRFAPTGLAFERHSDCTAAGSLLTFTLQLRFRVVLRGLATLAVALTLTRGALAQTQPQTIDTTRGPITGSTRQVGLGGAFVAMAQDTAGVAVNPASDAVRLPYSWDPFDYALGVDVSIGAWLPKNDIYNQSDSSKVDKSTAFFGSLAAVVNYEHFGLGVAAEAQRNAATRSDQLQGIAPTSLSANFGIVHASVAYGFYHGQLLLGVGPRLLGFSFGGGNSSSGLFSSAGTGYEAGFILKPYTSQARIAGAFKSPINATAPGDPGAPPNRLRVPWEASLGFAYQFGPRPLNPQFVTARHLAKAIALDHEPSDAEQKAAEDEMFRRYEARPRFYVLVSTELAIVEGTGAHVGFADGEVASTRPSFSPRLGLESEVVPHILKLRAGSYYEPARAADARNRIHGTGGFDLRLFEWDVFGLKRPFDYWQLSVAADAARSYLNTSFSIGFWH
jgi:hypothetical protein